MANQVKISKHSNTKLKFTLNKDTIYFLEKGTSVISSTANKATLSDGNRVVTFDVSDVEVPAGNTTLEVITAIQKVIES